MTKVITIGDSHVDDEQDLGRFDLAGEFILHTRPEYIVSIGDFLTLNCLSAWDMNKRKNMEGRRYSLEVAAGNEALDRLMAPTVKYNKSRKKQKKSQYNPTWVYVEGNHENRLSRYLEQDPTFEGTVGIEKDLRLKERGWVFVPYREYFYIDDVGFTHVPHNKTSPISGVDITRKAQSVGVKSVVFGHTHEQHLSHVHKEGMPHLQDTYNCGCFFDKKEDYAHGKVTNYWRGLSLLHIWKEGRFDVEAWSMGRLERESANGTFT